MLKKLPFLYISLLLILTIAPSIPAADQTVFGPKNLTIGWFRFHLSLHRFKVDAPGDGTLMVVKNSPGNKYRGGFVIFNGRFIPLRNFFSGRETIFEKDIRLRPTNRFVVFFRGVSRAFLTLEIKKISAISLPEVTFTADPASITRGQFSTLTWRSKNATSCIIAPGIGNVELSGSTRVTPRETTVYTLTATGPGGTVSETVTVNVANTPPVADAGADQNVYVRDIVFLDGSGSKDVDEDPLDYQWSFISVPQDSSATISDSSLPNPSFLPDRPGIYRIQLVVNDGAADSDPDSVEITATLKMVDVPAVVGMHLSEAEAAIAATGLTLGDVTTEYNETVPEDHVISQDPAAGNSVQENSPVNLTVSLGPLPPPPTASIVCFPASIQLGDSAELSWSSTDATEAFLEPDIGSVPVNGRLSVSPAATTRYTITVTGPAGTATDSVSVAVMSPDDIDYGLSLDEQQGGGGLVGETVRILNGNMVEFREDLNFASPHRSGLSFAATYNSRSSIKTSLGHGWSHSYSATLDPAYELAGETYLQIVDPTGRVAYFKEQSAGIYTGQFHERTRVVAEAGGYVWHRLDGVRYGYSDSGTLLWL
ncbi:MAG: PASTA domain-containing protein, partial [Planctomycetota bacterium]